jgi:hypothetical protein
VTDYFVEKQPCIKTPTGMTNIKFITSKILNPLKVCGNSWMGHGSSHGQLHDLSRIHIQNTCT